MISVTKIFTFDAGHRLSNYSGKCKRLHGHTYKVEITVAGDLDNKGMVIDFTDLKEIFKEQIDSKFDHKILFKKGDELNEAIAKALPEDDESIVWVDYNPTAENIANDILKILKPRFDRYDRAGRRFRRIERIRVYETPTSFVDATEDDYE